MSDNLINEILVEKFIITDNGDISVGAEGQGWEVSGYFNFADKEELNDFKEALKKDFEQFASGKIKVITDEELQQMCDEEDAMFSEYNE